MLLHRGETVYKRFGQNSGIDGLLHLGMSKGFDEVRAGVHHRESSIAHQPIQTFEIKGVISLHADIRG